MNAIQEEMYQKAHAVMANAYAPYSGLAVGACLRAEDGRLMIGCNVENAVLGLTQCAEANAIGMLFAQGGKRVQEILIISNQPAFCPPCGSCRQLLLEFTFPRALIHLVTQNRLIKTFTLAQLLPEAFLLTAKTDV